ncbi:hypothetical protein [Shimia sp.]|uniref:hypothetical protein n=1 Tax=Shimia sp. TaxID=1954381 RepID=UPI00329753D8
MNKNLKLGLAAGFVAAFGTFTGAMADSTTPVDNVEGWDIYKGDGDLVCVMERVMDNGYLVRMGKEKDGTDFGYIAVYTKDKDAKIYGNVTRDVVFDIDGTRFTGRSVGEFRNDWRGAVLRSNDSLLGEKLAKRYVMTLSPDSDGPVEISLDGTFKAMAATRECNY